MPGDLTREERIACEGLESRLLAGARGARPAETDARLLVALWRDCKLAEKRS